MTAPLQRSQLDQCGPELGDHAPQRPLLATSRRWLAPPMKKLPGNRRQFPFS